MAADGVGSMTSRPRVAVVTGAGSGIGPTSLAETRIACPPGQVTTYRVDVADRDAVRAYADDVRRNLGPTGLLARSARWTSSGAAHDGR